MVLGVRRRGDVWCLDLWCLDLVGPSRTVSGDSVVVENQDQTLGISILARKVSTPW